MPDATPPHPSAARIVALYERTAAAWDQIRGRAPDLERPWLDRLAAATRPGGRVLDLGCGTGDPVARYLLGLDVGVTGVDASPSLVALARARFAPAEYPGAEWAVADMRGLALGRTFDAVVAWHSLFHLAPDDQRAVFSVFARHAAPGAALLFTTGPAAGEAIGEWEGEPLYHASLDPDEYRALLAAHGFRELAHVSDDPACGGATVWLARRDGPAAGGRPSGTP